MLCFFLQFLHFIWRFLRGLADLLLLTLPQKRSNTGYSRVSDVINGHFDSHNTTPLLLNTTGLRSIIGHQTNAADTLIAECEGGLLYSRWKFIRCTLSYNCRNILFHLLHSVLLQQLGSALNLSMQQRLVECKDQGSFERSMEHHNLKSNKMREN